MNKTVQPMRADARRNRDQILAAAESAFAEEGLGVPVDEIARRAGVGTGTLYRHFPTKEALFEAVLLEHLAEVAAEAERRAQVDPPGRALFDFLGYLAVEGAVKRNLVDALIGAGIDVKSRATGSKQAIEASAQVLLGRAQEAGEVRADIALADLIGLVMGTCQFAGEHADECSQRRMLAVVCDGLRPPAPDPPAPGPPAPGPPAPAG